MSLVIFSKVKTEYGIGELICINTESNGLYINYNTVTCVIYFGNENPGRLKDGSGGTWISREFNYNKVVEMNKDIIRNTKIDKILEEVNII